MNKIKLLIFAILGTLAGLGVAILVVFKFISFQKAAPVEIPPVSGYTTIAEYLASLDVSCHADSDCTVKDVRNCCGTYPQCVNTRAQVDPDFVQQTCAKEGLMGVCGYPIIKGCKCVEGKCQAQIATENPQ